MTDRLLPTFLIIGAPKAGTTSLHHYLDQHPEISMSRPKETNYFRRPDYLDAREDYAQCFAHADCRIRGEASPWYSCYPYLEDVPQRIHSLLPGVKLIYLVREPVERAVAFYWERFASNHAEPFETAFANVEDPRNLFACASKYAQQLEQYFRFFPRSALLVVDSDDLRNRRSETLRSVFSFLGADPGYWSDRFDEELNTINAKLRPTGLARALRDSPPAETIRRVLPAEARERVFGPVRRATSRKVRPQPLPVETRRRLEDVLRPDIERFRELTGRPFENWCV